MMRTSTEARLNDRSGTVRRLHPIRSGFRLISTLLFVVRIPTIVGGPKLSLTRNPSLFWVALVRGRERTNYYWPWPGFPIAAACEDHHHNLESSFRAVECMSSKLGSH
jgi:hypothetical protein